MHHSASPAHSRRSLQAGLNITAYDDCRFILGNSADDNVIILRTFDEAVASLVDKIGLRRRVDNAEGASVALCRPFLRNVFSQVTSNKVVRCYKNQVVMRF